MAELATLARPYAKAAFDHANEQHDLANWSEGLATLAMLMHQPELNAYLQRPGLLPAQQVEVLYQVTGRTPDAAARNFLMLLANNGRLALLPEISREFERLRAQVGRVTDVQIESAFPLTSAQELLLTSRLEKRFGTQIKSTVVVNPDLIGGVIIRAGDQVIDDSTRQKLQQMRQRLIAS